MRCGAEDRVAWGVGGVVRQKMVDEEDMGVECRRGLEGSEEDKDAEGWTDEYGRLTPRARGEIMGGWRRGLEERLWGADAAG